MFGKKESKEPTAKQKLGQIGENAVCKYLENKGYSVIGRNYSKTYGEIDILAKKARRIHFIEVKSVSRVINNQESKDSYRAEDNLHPWKLKRLARTIQAYLLEKNVSDETEWQFDVAIVHIDMDKRLSRVSLLEDIVI